MIKLKKFNLNKDTIKKPSLLKLTCKTRESSHETRITS